jgi:hypothetical protein
MNILSYMLEVYKPNSESETICSFIAATPFPAIAKGESIKFFSDLDDTEWLVKKVVHLLWEVDNKVTFKTLVFTE